MVTPMPLPMMIVSDCMVMSKRIVDDGRWESEGKHGKHLRVLTLIIVRYLFKFKSKIKLFV